MGDAFNTVYFITRMMHQVRGLVDGVATFLQVTVTAVASSVILPIALALIKVVTISVFVGAAIARIAKEEKDNKANERASFFKRFHNSIKFSIILFFLVSALLTGTALLLMGLTVPGLIVLVAALAIDIGLEVYGLRDKYREIKSLHTANSALFNKLSADVTDKLALDATENGYVIKINNDDKSVSEILDQYIKSHEAQTDGNDILILKQMLANQKLIEANLAFCSGQNFYIYASDGAALIGVGLFLASVIFPPAALTLATAGAACFIVSGMTGVIHAKMRKDNEERVKECKEEKRVADEATTDHTYEAQGSGLAVNVDCAHKDDSHKDQTITRSNNRYYHRFFLDKGEESCDSDDAKKPGSPGCNNGR